ncbi:MAG: hypothetical protein H6741_31330 [Alphaproteobacteria bacterium]|nr:hypothetical protein [Alphaproteobacteria bacterium]
MAGFYNLLMVLACSGSTSSERAVELRFDQDVPLGASLYAGETRVGRTTASVLRLSGVKAVVLATLPPEGVDGLRAQPLSLHVDTPCGEVTLPVSWVGEDREALVLRLDATAEETPSTTHVWTDGKRELFRVGQATPTWGLGSSLLSGLECAPQQEIRYKDQPLGVLTLDGAPPRGLFIPSSTEHCYRLRVYQYVKEGEPPAPTEPLPPTRLLRGAPAYPLELERITYFLEEAPAAKWGSESVNAELLRVGCAESLLED